MSDSKVIAALACYPERVTLREPQWIRYADIAGALGALAIAYKIGTGTVACPPVGLFLALAGGLVMGLAIRDLRRQRSLTLDDNGFQLSGGNGNTTIAWSDVQHFREVGDDAFAVGFDLVSQHDEPEPVHFRFREHYGIRGPDLLALLTQWHAMSVGLRRPID